MLTGRNCTPELLNFLPYTPPQITNILKRRLNGLLAGSFGICSELLPPTQRASAADKSTVLTDPAISLCAGKVAASGGDLRCALNICRLGKCFAH